jgi:chemotaxis protein methyltransferase CheR
MALNPADFTFLSGLIKKRSGINLTEDKTYLLESRLLPFARKMGLQSIEELVKQLKFANDEKLFTDVTEAMTTNESSFFRDLKPFEQLRNLVIPRLLQAYPTKKKFRIWSSACSTGQEPYSIAMSILECQATKGIEFEIVATDLASHVLEKAKAGIYSQFEVQRGMPVTLLIKYFKQSGENWHINDQVRNMVKFGQCNLTESLAQNGTFDIVFCRNVLIYFDNETKTQVLHNLSKQMEPLSVLFLGCAESIFGMEHRFTPLKDSAGVFVLKTS